jgi:hypothetical protein
MDRPNIYDILKPRAKLTARKITKKEIRQLRELSKQIEIDRNRMLKIDWEALNKPMTI